MIKKRQKGLYYSFVELLSMSFNFKFNFSFKGMYRIRAFCVMGN